MAVTSAVPQSSATKKRPPLKVVLRRAFFFVHLWLGLFVGVYYAVIGATGSLLVVREDWDARRTMPERTYVAPPTPSSVRLPLSDIIARLRIQVPTATDAELAFMIPPPQPGGAYLWRFRQGRQSLTTTVSPYTGQIIRQFDARNTFLSTVDELHTDLLLHEPGRLANGWGGLLSGVILLSGLWLWWPQTVRQIKLRYTIKRGGGTTRLVADLHNVLGSYLFVLLFVATLSGAVIVFHQAVQKQVVALFGSARAPRAPRTTPPPGATPLPPEALLRTLEATAPDSQFVFLLYPTTPTQAVYGYKRSPSGILPDSRIYLNPYTGKTLQVDTDLSDPRSKQIMRANAALHFGRWGGWPVKVLYVVTGLLPLGLFVTGLLMSLRRWRSQRAKRRRVAAA